MPSFRSGTVTEILSERPGLQRVLVDGERAYVLTQLTGDVAVGDEVVMNTTAVELGLGTGGWHVVHWNLRRRELDQPGPGHIMKVRYTSLQADTGADESIGDDDDLEGMPVVACGLHSQVACVVAALRHVRPDIRIAYVMTDGAALPMAMSDLVVSMRPLLATTITAGHAFGGEHEAVNVPAALLTAKRHADVTVVGMGPGVVGTATKLGYSALEVGAVIGATSLLGGRPVAALRFSLADPRLRHQGVSHHTTTALSLGTAARATVGVPDGPFAARVRADLDAAGLSDRHRLLTVPDPGIPTLLDAAGLRVTSMGRGPDEDPGFYAVAGAAGTAAATLLTDG
ncbi:MAG TPA: DUF3866 family protein [Acidimicrobiales bacterium]|nr:DUF3866 family protein [Acidimicrobiales bacterium]